MKILLLTQLFQPEPNHLKGVDFVERLRANGHEVEVLTGFPHYPYGRLYPGYRLRLLEHEMLRVNGRPAVRVTRTVMFPSHDSSALRRMLTYLSFALSAAVLGLFLYRRKQFDIVHVYQGPATLMVPGMVLARRVGAKLVLDVQDLWPESVGTSGMMKSRVLLRMLTYWSDATYRAADRIIVLSNGYKKRIASRGIDPGKIAVIYNWCDESNAADCQDASMPDQMYALKHQGKSIVLYAGTMGHVQGLESVLEAAALLQAGRGDIHFAFVGNGVDVERLKGVAAEKKLSNVSFYPRAEAQVMQAILAGADALLIHFKKGALGDVGIPQKAQAYLAAGRPVVMAANGEAGELMKASNAAVSCEPGKPDQIADAVRRLFMKTREEREAMGKSGAAFYHSMMSIEIGIKHVIDIYESALRGHSFRRGMNDLASHSDQREPSDIAARTAPFEIRQASLSDVPEIVRIHRSSFKDFFLTCLGRSFLELLYREIMKEEGSVALVAVAPDSTVVGFAVGVSNQAHLYRRLALRRWFAFAAASSRAAVAHPGIIPRLFHAFAYVGKSRAAACPALLMSIAVSGVGKGIGTRLVTGFLSDMAARGVDRVCLTTDRDNNEGANRFYRSMGFEKVREYQTPQKRWMNEYVIQTKEAGV